MTRKTGWLLVLALVLAGPGPALALDKPPGFEPPPPEQVANFRDQARSIVIEIASYAKKRDPNFQLLMRGGTELVVKGEREVQWDKLHDPNDTQFYRRLPEGAAVRPLVKILDGLVVDSIYCGANVFGKPLVEAIGEIKALEQKIADEKKRGIFRPPVPEEMGPFSNDPAIELRRAAEIREAKAKAERQRRLLLAVDAMRAEGRTILTVEPCPADAQAAALRAAGRDRVIAFVDDPARRADARALLHPPAENPVEVRTLATIRNWVNLPRSDGYGTKAAFIDTLAGSNADMLVIDVAHRGTDYLAKADVDRLKYKNLGTRRLVLAVMPLGRAYDWRWYWQKGWEAGSPPFLFAHDDAPGTYITDMGNADWKALLGKYITGVMDLGFDGVMFDDVSTYLWFEDLMPLDH